MSSDDEDVDSSWISRKHSRDDDSDMDVGTFSSSSSSITSSPSSSYSSHHYDKRRREDTQHCFVSSVSSMLFGKPTTFTTEIGGGTRKHRRPELQKEDSNISDLMALKKVKINDGISNGLSELKMSEELPYNRRLPLFGEPENRDIDFISVNSVLKEMEMLRRFRRNVLSYSTFANNLSHEMEEDDMSLTMIQHADGSQPFSFPP
jgi:hypothetical protein